jgi:TM2 domain-containing membrane protein YozV
MPHHISDVDTWGGPDRNYFIFVVLSIVGGFLGADHFYLRSFGTGVQKLFFNIFGLGFWYWWDIIQIYKEGAKIRSEGLNGPFDWLQGIGRGVFTPLPSDAQSGGGAAGAGTAAGADPSTAQPVFAAKKSYIVYAFLAIFFGWLGLDKFYLGYIWQGMAKVLSCFNIFLFLFGWLWVVWDSVYAFFLTDKIMKEGITPPLPYSYVFGTIDPDLFVAKPIHPDAKQGSFFSALCPPIIGLPNINFGQVYKDVVAPLMIPPIAKGLQLIIGATGQAPAQSDAPTAPTAPTAPPMTGGGGVGSSEAVAGPGPVIAGTLTALVLAGGLKGFYDFISKQR